MGLDVGGLEPGKNSIGDKEGFDVVVGFLWKPKPVDIAPAVDLAG